MIIVIDSRITDPDVWCTYYKTGKMYKFVCANKQVADNFIHMRSKSMPREKFQTVLYDQDSYRTMQSALEDSRQIIENIVSMKDDETIVDLTSRLGEIDFVALHDRLQALKEEHFDQEWEDL